jgi:acyl-CoA thioesterase II
VADLPTILDLLDLEHVEPNRYQSRALHDVPWGMYGGQAAAQALYAAGLTVDPGRLPHSLHGYFVRRGDAARPTLFRVDRDRDGRSFSARRVVALQDDRVIFSLSASFVALAGPGQPFPDQEAEPAPDPPPLDSVLPWTHPKHSSSFEFRAVDQDRRLPTRFWIRCTTELPDDPLLHAAVLTYISDISTALIPFESEEITTGPSLDHAVWFHRPIRMDGWNWQELTPRTVAGGRGLYTAGVYAPDGTRLASVTQEQLFVVRRGAGGRD